MTRWLALGPDGDAWRYALMDGINPLKQGLFSSEDEARAYAQSEDAKIIPIGRHFVEAPAALLPDDTTDIPGITQSAPPEVLSGWNVIACAGFLSTRPHWDGVICLVGSDVTHWIQLSAGEAISFQGFLTGRLIRQMQGADELSEEAVETTLSRPETLAARLRQAELTADTAAITGHLIGAELAATRPYWLGQAVGLIGGNDSLARTFRNQGIPAECEPYDVQAIRGLVAWAGKADLLL